MPDLTDLLDRTSPSRLAPPDLAAIARRAAGRRRRRRLTGPLTTIAVLLAAGLGFVVSQGDDGPDQSLAAGNGIGDADLTEPIGEWRQVADPPFGPRQPLLTATLGDGRVLTWGSRAHDDERAALDGGIYDPTTDRWETIEPAPIADPLEIVATEVAADRLLVLMNVGEPRGHLRGAVYDVAGRTWTALPPQGDIRVIAQGVAWTGEQLALVRLSRGAPEYGGDVAADWRVSAPITLRWTYGDAGWTAGAPSPLGLRFGSAVAFDGARLAFVGGTRTDVEGRTTPAPPGPDHAIVDDGAIYDVATDTWTMIPAPPQGGSLWAHTAWLDDGRLFVGLGIDRLSEGVPSGSVVAAYDPAGSSWTELPSAPVRTTPSATTHASNYVEGEPTILYAIPEQWSSGPRAVPVYGPLGWELAPHYDLHRIGPHLVATSATLDNPDDEPMQAAVRTSAGTWLRTVDAPFVNRMEPGMAVVGEDSLLVIAGRSGPNIVPQADAWILDLDP